MVFQKGPSDAEKTIAEQNEQIATLERKVGQLTIESDWMKKKCSELLGPK
jgi:putative transposase